MNVTLNKNSWHYKLYSTVVDDNPPKSLCPYFWSLVAIILFSPFILLIAGGGWFLGKLEKARNFVIPPKKSEPKTWEQIEKEWEEDRKRDEARMKRMNKGLDIFIFTMKWIVAPVLGLLLLYFIYQSATKIGWLEFFMGLGVGIIFILPILGFIWLVDKYGEHIGGFFGRIFKKLNPLNWSITKIIGGMIYATYKKACPIINWEGKEENETENVYS